MKKTIYITTPIYYPSGDLHLGHIYSTNIAWVLRNYKKIQGYETFFSTGSDEHGQKIFNKAQELKLETQDYVDRQANKFIDFWKKANIDYDFFARTTNKEHKEVVREIFHKLKEKNIIYLDKYVGLYSVSDEEFLTETQALKKDNKFFHPVSNHELIKIEEESYFFNLNLFIDWIKEFLDQDIISSKAIVNELKSNFINKGLENLSVTRIKLDWGIKIDQSSKHVIYVWLDALFQYLTNLGYGSKNQSLYEKFWKNGDERVHVVGKEITRFHCIYWPIFLKSLNVKMPTKIISHGWIVTPEGKMSKSKGNVVDPVVLIEKYGSEVLKYFLIAKLSIKKDGVFSEELLVSAYNNDLVNTFSNLISRTVKMILNNYDRPLSFILSKDQEDLEIEKDIKNSFETFCSFAEEYEFDKAFESTINLGKKLNLYIDKTRPWLLTKEDQKLEIVLNRLLNGIYAMAFELSIVMPQTSQKLAKALGFESFEKSKLEDFKKFDNIKIEKIENLFNRIKL
ncbi:METHIONYL-TRNA SYNTHETASE (METHIONINE--TRNA LIGASE) (METRS) [Mycoplasmopsis pulmonis]|uniref:Methionine--tRNA ligase n=1 Tax=Mycoplasmopsis pulmonis (strain UAB CTIP) TaxID=272635 RepID=SYM_MYCPU|nr:methionine--tRNA ligase [Mycoplasmopsis pulmonis]Q50319.2 RecName: Full=Methionine--tRNA ligase; AltName: Full=Methionyl-tRNA synthetase; Short=MetRS [Mycoplasmopsis pulmonis UAB CTIP]MDZ7293500.1 methionine--tRNA ligase [Mycoplasmopsis pulmonis]CAC13663.1 METHIONYL-TRNA SYNTHETASE (METHIONINE--TRNA LIGASE) (METRS) [Mycoplasmopsis pulmonis]VEU68257.1 Methionine--tRNA ligase [Mycoplasmopsis pulmonis]